MYTSSAERKIYKADVTDGTVSSIQKKVTSPFFSRSAFIDARSAFRCSLLLL